MNTELSAIMATSGRVAEWANAVKYQNTLTNEDKEISAAMDAWAKEVGRTGLDANHEISALITKTFTPEVVTTPSALVSRMFDEGSIGEFDDYRTEVAPKNTIKVYESVLGGNVDRSFIDFTSLTPTWVSLQAETDIPLVELRKGGFKTVSNLISFINEALEAKKIAKMIAIVDAAITSQAAGYVNETGTAPTETSMKALALYLHDVASGETPLAFGLNKYMQVIAGLAGATTYATDAVKSLYNSTGFINQYAGLELMGFSGQKKLADNTYIVPDKRIFGIAGKIGEAVTRGETQVLQNTDINSEKIHIKVNGYQFGTLVKDISKVAKMVIA